MVSDLEQLVSSELGRQPLHGVAHHEQSDTIVQRQMAATERHRSADGSSLGESLFVIAAIVSIDDYDDGG